MSAPQQQPHTTTNTEPAAVAELVRVVLVGLVAAGWVTIPDATIAGIVSAVGVIGSIVLTWGTRRRVVPVVKTTGLPPT